MLKGVDIYAGTGGIEWHRVAEDNNAFVFARGAYGVERDKSVAHNVAAARAVGMKVGVYHFFRARQDPRSQLAALMQVLDSVNTGAGDLPPVIDIEDNPHYDGVWNPADNHAYVQSVRAWIDAVTTKVGKSPIIYTRASFWDALGNTEGLNACPLWVASYRADAPRLPSCWSTYTFWQHSDAGTVPGISGHVDINYFGGNAAQLASILL